MASSRQRKNLLDSVLVDGVRLEDPVLVKQEVVRHFSRQFSEQWIHRPKLSGPFTTITPEAAVSLEDVFTEAEIWEAIQDCDGNKAPGPDGFNLACIQSCWKIMKMEIIQLMHEFHTNGKLSRGINSSFIVLIPKKDNPIGLGDYRPISLVSSVYKVLAKVLSRRIKRVLPMVISEVQSAFVCGKYILDGVLIANEVVDGWKRSKKKGIILKLDFEKVYDSINWEFLVSMMRNFGFGEQWIRWMKTCISTAKISVLVNGAPTEEFQLQKELESAFRGQSKKEEYLGSSNRKGAEEVVLLEKEVVIFCGMINWEFLVSMMRNFGFEEQWIRWMKTCISTAKISVLVNGAPTEEFQLQKELEQGDCLSLFLFIIVAEALNLLLGRAIEKGLFQSALVGSQELSISHLQFADDTIISVRVTWKKSAFRGQSKKEEYLGSGNRKGAEEVVLLEKEVVIFCGMPKGVVKTLVKLQSSFLWGGSENKKKVHLVQWREATKSKWQRGLGVRDLGEVNDCLLLKWWWRYGNEDKALWKSVLCSRYDRIGGGRMPPVSHTGGMSNIWQDIVKLSAVNQGLKVEFPRLHHLSTEKEKTLHQISAKKSSIGVWQLQFRRRLFSWEEDELQRLLRMLASSPAINFEIEDSCSWLANNSGQFSVLSVWKWWVAAQGPGLNIPVVGSGMGYTWISSGDVALVVWRLGCLSKVLELCFEETSSAMFSCSALCLRV
ncbi:uncharacterized protein LOC114286614 [Camellia sinensis]|uniref:uncharacterized protein LOC114286614 n=1 Tax=Camellia sinensis TaxID=4442 RepID=UPI0010369567|nr:uncharacterized protein LOC114286614 [Camellia sinensis]